MGSSEDNLQKHFRLHSRFIINGLLGTLWVTTIIMFTLIIVGIYKIGWGIYFEFSNNDTNGLIAILDGIEVIFLSPLIYLLTLSLTKYISATRPEVDSGDPHSNPESKRKFINFAIMEIMNVKTLIVGLFISILTLHSLKEILLDKSTSIPILSIVSILSLLIFYYFVLDKLAEKLRFPD